MNLFALPQPVVDNINKLKGLVEEHPVYLPLATVATFLGMKDDTLRSSIDRGQCPFALGGKTGINRAYKIPTVTFYLWYTNHCGWK